MAEKALKLDVFAWEGTDKKGNRVKGESAATMPISSRPNCAGKAWSRSR